MPLMRLLSVVCEAKPIATPTTPAAPSRLTTSTPTACRACTKKITHTTVRTACSASRSTCRGNLPAERRRRNTPRRPLFTSHPAAKKTANSTQPTARGLSKTLTIASQVSLIPSSYSNFALMNSVFCATPLFFNTKRGENDMLCLT